MFKNSFIDNIIFALFIISGISISFFNLELYGSVFRFMPVFLLLFLIYEKNYSRFGELLFVFIATSIIGYVVKFSIKYLLNNQYLDSELLLKIAMRPINGEFDGFPSGHALTAFIALSYAFLYSRFKWKILIFILAILVCISRVYSLYHTYFQVVFGALGGFFISLVLFKIISRFKSRFK